MEPNVHGILLDTVKSFEKFFEKIKNDKASFSTHADHLMKNLKPFFDLMETPNGEDQVAFFYSKNPELMKPLQVIFECLESKLNEAVILQKLDSFTLSLKI